MTHTAVLAVGAGGAGLALAMWGGARHGRAMVSVVSAYAALVLMLFTVAVRPVAQLRRRRIPMSTDLRRDAGLVAAVSVAVHVIAALGNHFGGEVGRYFFVDHAARTDRFGWMTWSGVLATVLVLLLVATSNDASVRRLRKRWKTVQRAVHVMIAVSVAHDLLAARLLGRSTALLVTPLIAALCLYVLRFVAARG